MKERFTPELFLSISDNWSSILKSGADLDEIRYNLLNHINEKHFITYSDKDNGMHDLDLIKIRDNKRQS